MKKTHSLKFKVIVNHNLTKIKLIIVNLIKVNQANFHKLSHYFLNRLSLYKNNKPKQIIIDQMSNKKLNKKFITRMLQKTLSIYSSKD